MSKGSITRIFGRMQSILERFKKSPKSETESLFTLLFPGENYTAEQNGKLIQKLNDVCANLRQTEALPSAAVAQASSPPAAVVPQGRTRRAPKPDLDFAAYHRRYVALEFLYLGHDYDGLARQDSTLNTVEEHLFTALAKTRLVPQDSGWREVKFSRAGRTDKGVSALGQVAALLVRSNGRVGQPPVAEADEIDYALVLNKVLPDDIRVLGWTTVPDNFSARFSANCREYKYFIVDHGELDIERMRKAAELLLGHHDFRNFCKPDVVAVKTFERRILKVRVDIVPEASWGNSQLLQFYVRGTAFLYHQVRCMVAVLLMVGRGEEDPSIVSELLDIEKHPRKPSYIMASDEPLILAACEYTDLEFRRSALNYEHIHKVLEQRLNSHMIRAGLLKAIREKMWSDDTLPDPVQPKKQRKLNEHLPLLSRCKEPTIEERKRAKGLLPEVEGGEMH